MVAKAKPDFVRRELNVLDYQAQFADSQAPMVALIGGRGSGKSWAGCYRILLKASAEPGNYCVVAPTYTMLEDIDWRQAKDVADLLHQHWVFSPGRMTAELAGRSTILFRSADRPDRLRGLNLHGLWIDEAAQIEEEAWRVARLAVRSGHKPWIAVTTTPKGTRHWTYQVFGKPDPNVHVIRAKTTQNQFLDLTVRNRLTQEITGRWASQELEAQWIDQEGVEWPGEYWGDWLIVPPASLPIDRMQCRVIAVDPSLGKERGDYSAIVALGVADGLLWIEADLARRPPDQILRDTLVLADRWRPHAIGIESVAFQNVLCAELNRLGGCRWSIYEIRPDGAKDVRIRRLTPFITRRELRIADTAGGRLLEQQLRTWPSGDHDDGPDALEMAMRLLAELR